MTTTAHQGEGHDEDERRRRERARAAEREALDSGAHTESKAWPPEGIEHK